MREGGAQRICDMTWSHVTRWWRSRLHLAWRPVGRVKGKSEALKRCTGWWWSLGKTWRRWTDSTVKSKWWSRSMDHQVTWWYEVDHIMWSEDDACVASMTVMKIMVMKTEMKWKCTRQRYNLGHFISPVKGCVENCMTWFRIDVHTIKSVKLVCISVI